MSMTLGKLSLTLLLMITIISTVSFLPVQEARASTELAYDNGTASWNNFADFVGVRFSLPTGFPSARLLTVRYGWFYESQEDAALIIHIMATDLVTELTTPISTTASTTGWNSYDVSDRNIVVSGDFFVVLEAVSGGNHQTDNVANVGRSYRGDTPPTMTLTEFNLLLRVVIEPLTAGAVGGVIVPTNTLAILAPYLALAGLVVAVSAVVLVKRKRD